MPKNVNILIDANSISHITDLEFNRENAFRILSKHFNVMTCDTVNEEFKKGINKRSSSAKIAKKYFRKKANRANSKYKDYLNQKIIRLYYNKPFGQNDEGERDLVCAALELNYSGFFDRIIILSDDLTAIDYFIGSVNTDFKFGEIWSALDMIIYMYMHINEISFIETEEAIRDLASKESISAKKFKSNTYSNDQAARQVMISQYLRRLKKVNILKQGLPTPK